VSPALDLRHHGDAEVTPDLVDCAVNVRLPGPPTWLQARLAAALDTLGRYPDPVPARAAVAARHGRRPAEVLLTAGAAEAFVLLARALRPRLAVCVHPSFTAPEAALRAAEQPVRRVVLSEPFTLDPTLVPADADLVVLGNPTNPTSVLHPADVVAALARPGRVLVVDEAFADCVPGEPESLATRADLPGLVVVRSLTKTWGLAGLRVGYLLTAPDLVARLADAQPPWSVSSLALVAAQACSSPGAVAAAAAAADDLAERREWLAGRLGALPGVRVVPRPAASFLLLHVPDGLGVRARLRTQGVAVRRGDTFPGLGSDWLRLAVRDHDTNARVAVAFSHALSTTALSTTALSTTEGET
jgi:histidinol-phosphate aminotransferase